MIYRTRMLINTIIWQIPFVKDGRLRFRVRLDGVSWMEGYPFPVESPYTGEMLPAILHRIPATAPRARLLQALRTSDESPSDSDFINVVHLRSEFVPQVNRLLRNHFWPGIDVSETLEWPDTSLLLTYRTRLVIGCVLCNPEGYISYLLVHPDWRSFGLAGKLLYLLLTRCLKEQKDVGVHVAVGNPAMMLYQRFGFKPEEFIVDFYGSRYRQGGPEGIQDHGERPDPASRNAFYLRLQR